MSDDDGIWQQREWPDGWSVRYVVETGSTNADLLDAVEHGSAGHRSALAAGHQTAGRGRRDRRWDAPPGTNLLVSMAFTEVPDPPVLLTQSVGLAVVAAVESVLTERRSMICGLKWPNDVLLGGRKVAGILAARSALTGAVVVGTGVNVAWSPAGAADLSGVVTPPELLGSILTAFDSLGPDVGDLYENRLLTLNSGVRVHLPNGEQLVGRAVGVESDGRLRVLDEGGVTHRLDAADVVHLRPLDPG